MNRLATPNHRLKSPSTIIAKLDLQDKNQRRLYSLIHRFHTGRWPLFRCLGMRQVDGVLYEAVEWLRMAKPSFSVVRWRPDGLGLSWITARSHYAALTALKITANWLV